MFDNWSLIQCTKRKLLLIASCGLLLLFTVYQILLFGITNQTVQYRYLYSQTIVREFGNAIRVTSTACSPNSAADDCRRIFGQPHFVQAQINCPRLGRYGIAMTKKRHRVYGLWSALADPANLHLVFILRGQKTVARVETLLKSILYYQGRLNETADACRLFQDEPRICANRLVPRQKPLNIHVIGDTETRNLTQHFLTKWHLRNLKWTLYKLEDYVALLIDSDVLLNDNIIELWDHFDRFNQNQMIGLEWEQRTANEQCERSSTWPIPLKQYMQLHVNLRFKRYGINTGVILMHLTRLREQQWDGLWRDGANRYLRYKFIFTQGEQVYTGDPLSAAVVKYRKPLHILIARDLCRQSIQKYDNTTEDIINEAIHIRPEIYYKLPCEWHFQLYSHISALCCPVVWPNRRMDDTDCISRADEPESVNRPRIVRLVHFDTRPKPDDTEQEALIPPGRTNISRGLTTEEMKVRFRAMYYQFKKIPPECFR